MHNTADTKIGEKINLAHLAHRREEQSSRLGQSPICIARTEKQPILAERDELTWGQAEQFFYSPGPLAKFCFFPWPSSN